MSQIMINDEHWNNNALSLNVLVILINNFGGLELQGETSKILADVLVNRFWHGNCILKEAALKILREIGPVFSLRYSFVLSVKFFQFTARRDLVIFIL